MTTRVSPATHVIVQAPLEPPGVHESWRVPSRYHGVPRDLYKNEAWFLVTTTTKTFGGTPLRDLGGHLVDGRAASLSFTLGVFARAKTPLELVGAPIQGFGEPYPGEDPRTPRVE